ncbi:MAG: hypothetical protein FWH03_01285 [Firmicutes bacterium]|nr:hypothetical protein [Bacillota bacterium]
MKSKVSRILCALFMTVAAFGFVAGMDPSVPFDSLEEMQAVLPDYYYYFDSTDFDEPSNLFAVTNNSRACSIGSISYIRYTMRLGSLNIVASLDGKFLNYLDYQDMVIDGVYCKFHKGGYDNVTDLWLYFILENVLYSFQRFGSNISIENFLSDCESAIIGRYKV